MESISTLLILFLLVLFATIGVTYVVIYGRKRHVQKAKDKAGSKAAEERQQSQVEQEARRKAEEKRQRQEVEAQRRAAEERKHHEAEEAHRKVEEERLRREAEEAQRKVEEERQRHEAEETQRKAEEVQRKAEEERLPHEIEEAQYKAEGERLRRETEEGQNKAQEGRRLEDRGGRPRIPRSESKEQVIRGSKLRHLKPEIVCSQREREWIPAVELPEDIVENPNLQVLQNGLPLTQHREGCWRLEHAFGEVVVRWTENEGVQETKVLLKENYLLFKLSGQNQNQGRRVKSPSSGWYLVMVPNNWERDDTLSGPPPVVPEFVSLTGYQAHFFILEKDCDEKIAFRTPGNEPLTIEPTASRFELVGAQLNDASEDMGPFFGERPPQIRTLYDMLLKEVGTIVIGEEGSGKRRWRKAFDLIAERAVQDLPSEVAERRGGWYFLRFYDSNDDLVDSLDFRFLSTLKEIRIAQPSPLPSEVRHKPVRVEFFHELGCAVQPADGLTCSVQIEHKDDKTVLTIPADSICDETYWLVGPESGPQVEVTILVERVWWAVVEEKNAPSEWEDQLFTLPHEDFAAISKKALWLRLPKRRWIDRVLVGFEQSSARPFPVKVTEKTVAIPLRDFGDTKEVGDRKQKHALKVWIKLDDGFVEGVVSKIPAQFTVPSELPTPTKQTMAQTNALCKGGNVIYGSCRHCRKKAEEIRAK